MTSTHVEHSAAGSLSAAISNLVVRLMAEYTGRGPTRARTYIKDDCITVVLQDTLTKGERSLVDDGRTDLVLMARKAYQTTMRHDMRSGIEELTGRRVLAFMSDSNIDPDVAAEVFLLAPEETGAGA